MITRSLAAAVAVFVMTGCDATKAQEPPQRVSWLTAPQATHEDYPAVAGFLVVRANAAVKCITNADGYARECVAVAHPSGFGFEEVAIEIAKRGRIKANWDGDTTENLTFSFNIPFGENLDYPLPPERPWDGAEPTAGQFAIAKNLVDRIEAFKGREPYEGRVPNALKEAMATELAAENAAFLVDVTNTHGLTELEARNYSIRMYARMLTLPGVENRIERIINFGDPQVLARAIKAEGGEGFNSATWRMRNAYCSRYDCTSKRAEEPEAPAHWQPRDDEPFPPYQPAD